MSTTEEKGHLDKVLFHYLWLVKKLSSPPMQRLRALLEEDREMVEINDDNVEPDRQRRRLNPKLCGMDNFT